MIGPLAVSWPGSGPGRRDAGQVGAFVVVFTTALLLLAGLVLDGGLALAAKVRAVDDAQSAARAGAQAIDLAAYRRSGEVRLMPERASEAARAYLEATESIELSAASVSVAGDLVTVTVRDSQSTQLLQMVGIDSLTVTATATARAEHGVTTQSSGSLDSDQDAGTVR